MKSEPDVRSEISASTEHELFGLFFREYDNRYKYCNGLSYHFEDTKLTDRYRIWHANVDNYASNGGDMW
jgi:hypothetical protein